jgi:hypothetical protein
MLELCRQFRPSGFRCRAIAVAMLAATFVAAPAAATLRIKDIADVEGVRDNLLVGHGRVAGIDGSGDSLRNSAFTEKSPKAMLERLGVSTRAVDLQTKNVAAVVIATLPPFPLAEAACQDMLDDEVAKPINRTGGISVADAVLREMVNMQEVA